MNQSKLFKNGRTFPLLLVVTLLFSFCGCSGNNGSKKTGGDSTITNFVYTSNESTRYITAKLLGDSTEIKSPDIGSTKTADWIPTDDEIRLIQKAMLIIDGGIKSAGWMIKVSLPDYKKVDLTTSVFEDLITVENLTTHQHGPEGEHSHSGVVSEVWLNPQLLSKQAGQLAERLSTEYPQQKEEIANRLKDLQSELNELYEALDAVHDSDEKIEVVTYAPVYKYFCQAAKMNDQHFHWDLSAPLSKSQLEKLDEYCNSAKPVLALVAEEPDGGLRQQLEDRGLTITVVDLCTGVDSGKDYAMRFKQNVEQLKSAIDLKSR